MPNRSMPRLTKCSVQQAVVLDLGRTGKFLPTIPFTKQVIHSGMVFGKKHSCFAFIKLLELSTLIAHRFGLD